jgi:hypothetical protein
VRRPLTSSTRQARCCLRSRRTAGTFALSKIRQALDLFLHLPNNQNVFNLTMPEESIAVQRLQSSLQMLHGQMSLARAEIQAKDATIQALQVVAEHRNQFTPEAFVASVEAVTAKHREKEQVKLLGGILCITKYEGPGVNVDLAELARRAKLSEIVDGMRRFFAVNDEPIPDEEESDVKLIK